MASMQRAKNTASQSEIGRILRAHLDVEVVDCWLKDRVFQPEQVANGAGGSSVLDSSPEQEHTVACSL